MCLTGNTVPYLDGLARTRVRALAMSPHVVRHYRPRTCYGVMLVATPHSDMYSTAADALFTSCKHLRVTAH